MGHTGGKNDEDGKLMMPEVLQRIVKCEAHVAAKWAEPLTRAMDVYEINSPLRQAAFVAQIAHESAAFLYVRELGSDAYLSKYDTGKLAQALGNTPEADGDGQRYRGRGLIQITGRANYQRCGEALGLDLLIHPELLEMPDNAALSAAWFWSDRKLNQLADEGDFIKITRRINGGLNGFQERVAYYARAKAILLGGK